MTSQLRSEMSGEPQRLRYTSWHLLAAGLGPYLLSSSCATNPRSPSFRLAFGYRNPERRWLRPVLLPDGSESMGCHSDVMFPLLSHEMMQFELGKEFETPRLSIAFLFRH